MPVICTAKRQLSDCVKAFNIMYSQYGDPLNVLVRSECHLERKLKPKEVLIKMLAAAIHPADINTVQGQYPIKPNLPAIGGGEGFGKVIDVGTEACLKIDDYVIPRDANTGMWTNLKKSYDSDLIKVTKAIEPSIGAIASVNPGTAYRMLKDFVKMGPGDCFIQTGGTSAVGIYATQLGRLWGIKSISIIRSRSSKEATDLTKSVLAKEYGADFVLTEEETVSQLPLILKQTGLPKLALNCVGGKAIVPLLKALNGAGVLVTYGGMNRLPLQVPVSSLIFADITFKGFWMSRWSKVNRNSTDRQEMLSELWELFESGSLRPSPFVTFDFLSDWSNAIKCSMFSDRTPEGISKKSVLVMNE